MKRVVSFLVIASMAVILTGCEGEDPLKTFTYTASAGSGGTISPEGLVSITQGEDLTFTTTPDEGKIVNEWKVNGNVVAMSGNSYTVTNVQSDGTIQVTFKDYIVWQLTPTMTATLDDKGVLTISTTKDAEAMPNPRFENLPDGSFRLFPFWIKDEIDYRERIISGAIRDGVTNIASMTFNFCTSLTSVTIPNSVTTIDAAAIGGCHSLTSITIPNSVTNIGLSAFRECISLASITIPNSVTTISQEAFMDCKALTTITIPNSVTTIGRDAFKDCTALTSVTIPSSVTTLGDYILWGCTNVKDVKVGWMTPPSNGLFNSLSIYSAATLYVPSGTKDLYQAANPWQYFGTIVEY